MLDPPYVYWDADPYSYYTLMVEDVDLNGGRRYFHFLLYNIPGNNVTAGQVAFDWAPSFAFNLDTSSSPPVLNTEDRDFTHAHLYLIYRSGSWNNWSTRPTAVPAGSDHYFHT